MRSGVKEGAFQKGPNLGGLSTPFYLVMSWDSVPKIKTRWLIPIGPRQQKSQNGIGRYDMDARNPIG